MRQVLIVLGLASLLAIPAVAQETAQPPADAPPAQAPPAQPPAQTPPPAHAPAPALAPGEAPRSRLDISVGYTYMNYDQQDEPRLNMSGFNLGVDVNLRKWLELGGTFSGDYNRQSSDNPGINGTRTSIINFMVGPRIYFHGHHHQRSYFFDGLIGGSDIDVRPPYLPPLPNAAAKDKVLSWGVGGGLDYALSPRFAMRAEANYLKTGFFGGRPPQNNAVASVSIVYHLPRLKVPQPKKRKKK